MWESRRICALCVLLWSLGPLAVGAQEPPPEQDQPQDPPPEETASEAAPMAQEHESIQLDEDEMESFARAYIAISEIREEFTGRLEEVDGEEEVQRIQSEASTAMTEAIENAGLEVETYQEIASALSADPELREEVTERVARMREE